MERLKKLLDKLEIDILNIEYCQVGIECNHRNSNTPYSRIYVTPVDTTKVEGLIQSTRCASSNREPPKDRKSVML